MAAILASSPLSATPFKSPSRAGARLAFVDAECDRPAVRGRRASLREKGMDENYAVAQSQLTQWRRDVTQSVGSEMQHGLRELCCEQAQLVDLRADLVGTQGLVDAAVKLREDGERLAETVEKAAVIASERSENIASARDEFLQQRDANMQALRHEKEEVEMQKKLKSQRQREIKKLLGTYHDRLGLTITRHAPQTVRMVFSLLDSVDPAREFSFQLGLSEAENDVRYEVCECSPSLSQLPALLAELNGNVDAHAALPRFVCSMRRAFSSLAPHHKL